MPGRQVIALLWQLIFGHLRKETAQKRHLPEKKPLQAAQDGMANSWNSSFRCGASKRRTVMA
jgi:hypothetical protein